MALELNAAHGTATRPNRTAAMRALRVARLATAVSSGLDLGGRIGPAADGAQHGGYAHARPLSKLCGGGR